MAQFQESPEQQLKDSIKRIWGALSDEEIGHHEDMRDVFFLAVRKKYGVPRAQAEDMLRHLPLAQCPQAA